VPCGWDSRARPQAYRPPGSGTRCTLETAPEPITRPPLAPPAAWASATVFGALARLRGRRALHPRGTVRTATLRTGGDERLPAAWRALDGEQGLVRLSRAAGLPPPLPDVRGVALRVGGQDLLWSSADPLLRRMPWPVRAPERCTFSSLFPYRAGELCGLLLAVLHGDVLRLALRDRTKTVGLGTVTLGQRLEAGGIHFDPFRIAADIVPVGFVHRLRPPAYAASRANSPG
jgi:hypothetical protein